MNQAAIDAARQQFEEERLFPYKQVQFMQSLLQGLPLETQAYSYQQPAGINELLGTTGGILGILSQIFPGFGGGAGGGAAGGGAGAGGGGAGGGTPT